MYTRASDDLRWLCHSPSLVTSDALQCPTVAELPVANLEASELESAMRAQQSEWFRLGSYFEILIAAYLRCSDRYSDVRTNVAVHDEKRTVGELDFLLRNQAGETEHWESAIKFYLYAPGYDPDPNRCFLGPRAVDRLDLKLQRMRTHQLRLSQHPATRAIIGLDDVAHVKALVRGRLFYPLKMDWQSCCPGTLAAPDHLRGWWSPLESTPELPAAEGYVIARKQDWMTCPPACSDSPPLSLESLTRTLHADIQQPVQVIGVDSEHRELHRGFVVPNRWPAVAEASLT